MLLSSKYITNGKIVNELIRFTTPWNVGQCHKVVIVVINIVISTAISDIFYAYAEISHCPS